MILFVPMGQRIVAAAIDQSAQTTTNPQLTTALLLNIALILLAWRRTKDLKQALAANALAQQSAHDNAFVDHVTGLANRRELMRALSDPALRSKGCALLLLDLDFFKKVNDLYGHVTGDEVLTNVAEILLANSPEGSCCARLGGDEFAVLVAPVGDEMVNSCVAKIIHSIAEPLRLETATVHVSASVGISRVEEHMSAEVCLRRSDIAMYSAKRAGRNCKVWFDAEMERELIARTQLEDQIRDAIAASEFVPFYQPQIDLSTGQLTGFEVLARWRTSDRGILEPAEFIDVAESSGLICELSLSVMRQAFNEARDWPGDLKMAVNISAVQFRDPHLAERILKLLTESGFPASRLEVEITESTFLEDRQAALAIVESLKNMGVTISLDDFGTGYASLSQLQSLPFDRIKIDKSFVGSLLEDTQSDAIVSTILSLGRALELPITAEGIEDRGTKDRLRLLGCSDGQGWLFGKAVSGSAVRTALGLTENPDGNSESGAIRAKSGPQGDRKRRAGGGRQR
jgi:diguanylate cyclase (GGDEF)-like protein